MSQHKICMVGAFAVGKTSLVNRFVHDRFDENYLTTVGVKIDQKRMQAARPLDLLLWDIHGEDAFQKVNMSYLRGAAGLLLVADGTRPTTIDKAISLLREAEQAIGKVPVVLAINKSDLQVEWDVSPELLKDLQRQGIEVRITSARDGSGVAETFQALADCMLAVECPA